MVQGRGVHGGGGPQAQDLDAAVERAGGEGGFDEAEGVSEVPAWMDELRRFNASHVAESAESGHQRLGEDMANATLSRGEDEGVSAAAASSLNYSTR